MYRKIEDHKSTAAVGQDRNTKKWMVTAMYDDGWENILDYRMEVASEAEGIAHLIASGFEEYDPNAKLKAGGFVWNGYYYEKPKNV